MLVFCVDAEDAEEVEGIEAFRGGAEGFGFAAAVGAGRDGADEAAGGFVEGTARFRAARAAAPAAADCLGRNALSAALALDDDSWMQVWSLGNRWDGQYCCLQL